MHLLHDPMLAALRGVAQDFVFVIFVIIALLLMVVILLQEGKGGGLGGAFGGAAADTFGVKAGTVNKFTTYLAAGFLGLALIYAGLSSTPTRKSVENVDPGPGEAAPLEPAKKSAGDREGAPAEGGAPSKEGAPVDEGAPDEGPAEAPVDEGDAPGGATPPPEDEPPPPEDEGD